MIFPGDAARHWPLAAAVPAQQDPEGILPATMRRAYFPGPRHAEILQMRQADNRPNSVADGAHLTEAGTPDLAGLPVVFPKYMFLGYNGEASVANYAGCYAAAEAAYTGGDLPSRRVRAVLTSIAQVSDVHRWITGFQIGIGGSNLLDETMYKGGDLFAALVITGSLDGNTFIDSTGLWDLLVQDVSEPIPAGTVLVEQQTDGSNVTRLIYYPEQLALRTAALTRHAARFRKFRQQIYASSAPIGTLSTTYAALYTLLSPGPESAVTAVGTAAAAGAQAVQDASSFL